MSRMYLWVIFSTCFATWVIKDQARALLFGADNCMSCVCLQIHCSTRTSPTSLYPHTFFPHSLISTKEQNSTLYYCYLCCNSFCHNNFIWICNCKERERWALPLSLDAPGPYHKHKQVLSAPWATASAHCSFRLMSLHLHFPSYLRTLSPSDDDNEWRQKLECPDLEEEARTALLLWMYSP